MKFVLKEVRGWCMQVVSLATITTACLSPAVAQGQPHPACTFREGFRAPTQLPNPEPLIRTVLKTGTPVRLRFRNSVSSRKVSSGGPVELQVLEEIQVHGLPVILKGAQAWGIVQRTREPRFAGGEVEVEIQFSLDLTGGEVPLAAIEKASGDEDLYHPDAVGLLVGVPALYLLEGAKLATAKTLRKRPKWSFLQLIGGGHAVILKDTEITASVGADVCYDTTFLRRVREQMETTQVSER